MAFNKIGAPQPLDVIHTCSCGKAAIKIVNGQAYCNDCLPNDLSNDVGVLHE